MTLLNTHNQKILLIIHKDKIGAKNNWFFIYHKMTKDKKPIWYNEFNWQKNKVLARFLKQVWR